MQWPYDASAIDLPAKRQLCENALGVRVSAFTLARLHEHRPGIVGVDLDIGASPCAMTRMICLEVRDLLTDPLYHARFHEMTPPPSRDAGATVIASWRMPR